MYGCTGLSNETMGTCIYHNNLNKYVFNVYFKNSVYQSSYTITYSTTIQN